MAHYQLLNNNNNNNNNGDDDANVNTIFRDGVNFFTGPQLPDSCHQLYYIFVSFHQNLLLNDFRFGKFIKPEHVAEKIVDGIRVDQRYIYIPSHMWISDAMNLYVILYMKRINFCWISN